MNVEVSNHMQALEDDQIKTLDKSLDNKKATITKQNTQNNHQNNKTITTIKIITNKATKVTRIKRQ